MSAQAFDSADTIRAVGTFNVDTTGHALRVEPIGLGQSAAARQQEAGGIENDGTNPTPVEQPRQPEAIVADLVAKHRRELPRSLAFRLGSLYFQDGNQVPNVVGFDFVNADFALARWRKGKNPAGLAELKGDAAYVANIHLIGHERAPLLTMWPSKGGTPERHPLHRIYYAPDMRTGSEDPADLSKTVRVLTILLASEW